MSEDIYIYIYIYCHGVKNHTTRTVPINARRVDLLVLKKVRRWQTGVEVRWCSLCSLPWSLCRVPVLVLDGGYPVPRCYLRGGSRDERERLAAVFLEVELNSGEICWAYNTAGWRAGAGTDQPVTRKCRCSASVSRATLMRYRDARHNIYIYTLTGPPFAFSTALILGGIDSTRCWKHSSEILVHIDMIASRGCCCTSMMKISRSTTSQRCSIGLTSGDCGGHFSKVNSMLCSRNQSEMIWALWHAALSCWK